MTVIEYAERRVLEAEEENRKGADNEYLLRYWSAYLDGALAQKKEAEK